MSAFEHHATVDKGLKMKIKRKNVDKMEKSKKDQNKSEQNNADTKLQSESSHSANGILADKTGKLSIFSDHEKSPKSKSGVTKKDKGKTMIVKNVKSDNMGSAGNTSANGIDILLGQSSGMMEPKLAETPAGKKDCVHDPYEFNAKVEDGISTGIPISKKLKMDKEKTEMASGTTSQCTVHVARDASTDTQDVAVVTDPDCLGPCEPGTQVTLEGIVWHESDNGVLVVNVTWRGKTYVGTLLDATRHDWAPPRINCDSPTVELEVRTPKGRGKRRGAANTPVNDTRTLRKGRRGCSVQAFTAPPSPAKSDISTGGLKRKGRPQDIDLSGNDTRSKRSRSQAPTPNSETPTTDVQGYIECPEPNCNKKYRHANGLKYHQSHAHSNSNLSFDDSKEDMDTEDMPLSVMKNNVKKEKEALKKDNDTNKKEPAKDNSPGDKLKWDISELGSVTKAEHEESNDDDKEAGNNKIDQKFDNMNSAKKKDSNGSNVKVTSGQINSGNSVKTTIAPSSATKPSNVVALSPDSSQGSSNSMQPVASQILSTSSYLSSVSSLITVTASTSTSLSLSSISSPTSKPASPSLISSIVSVTLSDTSKSEVKLVDIKPKMGTDMLRVTKQNRPIVPAPSHTVVANVQVTHSNLSPVVSHTQISPQLKPIQPKPTIMGEPQNVNQSLADLNKDRKKMQKIRLKEGAQTGSTPNRPEQPTIKIERDGVIKPNPIPSSSKQLCEQNRKDGSRSNDSQRSQLLAPHSHKGADFPHSRGIQNPNLLKVGSPLQVHTPDNAKGLVTDDVQSPAYSDISDANESASPAALSDTSPQKPKEEPVSRKEEKREASPPQMTEGQMMPHYGMYPYYAQSQYIMNMSPGQKSSSSSSSVPSQRANTNLENKSSSAIEKKNITDEQKPERKQEEKESTRPKSAILPMSGMSSSHMTPQQIQEYQMQLYHQQMYIQSLPRQLQYQYMANGWYPSMDMAYMQQMMEEQRRAQSEQNKGRSERDGAQNNQVHEKPCEVKSGHDSKIHGIVGHKDELSNISIKKPLISPGQNIGIDYRNDNIRSHDDRNTQEQALRDKQSENHQILKENIDLKNEMDKNKQNERRQEELRRNMYQEQKKLEEKKKMDLVRKGESRPESVTPKAPGTKPLVEHSLKNFIPGQHVGNENVSSKRDINSSDSKAKESSKDVSANKYSDSGKSSDEKSKTPVPEKNRADSQVRNPELSKQKLGCSSSKSCSPTSSISSSSIPATPPYNIPYSHAVPAYAYMQSPHFMGIDHGLLRSHSVNAAMLGGYPAPGYIHPSQMDYRSPVGDEEKDSKSSGPKSVLPTVDGCDIKKGDLSGSHGPYYGQNVHKIHELTEKVRPKSRTSSPVPLKSTDLNSSYEKHRDYTNSPPTQRHVHTHHHTHVLQPGPGLPAGPPLQAPGFSPVYDPYGAMFVSQTQSPHPFPPK